MQELEDRNAIALEKRRKAALIAIVLAAAIAMILIFSLVFRNVMDNKSYSTHIQTAQMSMINGDYESALSSLRKAASIDNTQESALMMAQCYEAQGNYDKAQEILRTLDTTDEYISNYITSLENEKRSIEASALVTINGKSYDASETSIVLDNTGAGNSVVGEVSALYALNNLSLANNSISDISGIESLGGLKTLNLSNNQVSDISPLSGLQNLRTLYLDNNPVSDFTPLYSMQSLTTLSVKGISMTETQLSELSQALPGCTINGADAQSETETIYMSGVSFDADATSLDLSYCGITDISALSKCEKLTTINLAGNSITDITPLMDIPGLVTVNLSNNMISDVRPLMGLSSIKNLNLSGNLITTTVPLGMLNGLQSLDLSGNDISNFSGLRKLKNLTTLSLSGCGLQDSDAIYFQVLSKLVSLNIENNDGISGEGFETLQSYIPSCSIAHSELVYTRLFDGNQVSSNTTQLQLSGRGISDLSALTQFSTLESIDLSVNNISDLYYFSVTDSWQTLKYLNLSNNYISDVSALSHLINLETLNLSNNSISNVTALYGLTGLRTLYIGGNALTDEQILELERTLTDCEVVLQ